MEQNGRLTLWYDGGCPLCLREIALMKRLDKRQRIRFIDLTEAGASCPLERSLMLRRLHAQKGETLYSGAAAFAAMWREIPALRWLGLLAKNKTILGMLEYGYVKFLRIRPFLQRWLRRPL
ncbi:hypothetical protein AA106555_1147 [Neokomagataea thailandica NBRC 106555]|uniref:DUF393 domain-containing protein n=2 Tax=Neokomagataea TaxID=1223423 RepID=A0A4Y6V6Q4_9PROT|nr:MULTISPECIES: DUF393 domain-containing protein [Neokomagataea]QDH24291.1 DUF393 domain-containing protein [Neokomagataea tanensis]GBR53046.1 hypothetical protein AA106555_1147 [Neokomagataea thailandica NBRC 106555]